MKREPDEEPLTYAEECAARKLFSETDDIEILRAFALAITGHWEAVREAGRPHFAAGYGPNGAMKYIAGAQDQIRRTVRAALGYKS